jgi:hypothetical protein
LSSVELSQVRLSDICNTTTTTTTTTTNTTTTTTTTTNNNNNNNNNFSLILIYLYADLTAQRLITSEHEYKQQ